MMLYRISIVSDEIDDFLREITINAEATFLDLHKAIIDACQYPDDQLTSFFLCNDEWEQKEQITREDMGFGPSDQDIYVMGETRLSELIDEEKQRFIYVFDPISDRCFYMELTEIITGQTLEAPICSKSHGKAPKQMVNIHTESTTSPNDKGTAEISEADEEEFYGSDGFESDEFDSEGFEISEDEPYRN